MSWHPFQIMIWQSGITEVVWNMTDLLRRGFKIVHLRLMAELEATGQIGLAAQRMGITQPAASRLLAEAEEMAGVALRRRQGRGIALTPEGAALARRARRVLTEIADAGREIAEIGSGDSGHVRLGSVTGPALDLVLPALRAARLSLPGITVEVEVGTTDILSGMVRDGRLDFALCRLPEGGDPAEFDLELLGSEPVSLVVRRDHALAGLVEVPAARLMDYDWILPGPGAILRRTVLDRLRALGLPEPQGRLSTASFLLTLAWITQSNAIAPLATPVARQFAGTGAFAILPDTLGMTVAPFGFLNRRDTAPTPAARRIRALIGQTAGERSRMENDVVAGGPASG